MRSGFSKHQRAPSLGGGQKREAIPERRSKKEFSKTAARHHKVNDAAGNAMRGGIRL